MKRIILLAGIATATVALLVANETRAQGTSQNIVTKNAEQMIYQDVYPVFITKDLKASKDFYSK